MDYSSTWALSVRALGQRLGVLRPAVRLFRRLTGQSYEEAFDRGLMSSIQPGDCVWDVGANVGVYTTRFSAAVGPVGRVLAFEPSPSSILTLRANCASNANVEIVNVALSDTDGEAEFFISEGGHSPTDGFSPHSSGAARVLVPTARGDNYLEPAPPTIVKVDVEGFELEVLRGMPRILASPHLRALFIEVHFLASVERGEPRGPAKLTTLLREAGLCVRWIDPSHLVATK